MMTRLLIWEGYMTMKIILISNWVHPIKGKTENLSSQYNYQR